MTGATSDKEMMIYRGHLPPSSSQIDSCTIQSVRDSLQADGNRCSDADKHCELSFERLTCLCGAGKEKKKSIQSLFRSFASAAA